MSSQYVPGPISDATIAKEQPPGTPGPRRTQPHLTPRESEIVRYVLLGESNKQIARRLGISNYTVRDHVSNLLKKSGVTSRSRLGFVLSAPAPQANEPAEGFPQAPFIRR
jgi:DNA-binding NarL/FixJ family response regulator